MALFIMVWNNKSRWEIPLSIQGQQISILFLTINYRIKICLIKTLEDTLANSSLQVVLSGVVSRWHMKFLPCSMTKPICVSPNAWPSFSRRKSLYISIVLIWTSERKVPLLAWNILFGCISDNSVCCHIKKISKTEHEKSYTDKMPRREMRFRSQMAS